MIRKVLLSTVAIVAISGSAFAADLPSRRAPPVYVPPPVPLFTWTGFYIGGDIGYGFGKDTATQSNGPAYNVGKHDGVIGGGHIGYNFSTQSLPVLSGLAGGIGGGGLVLGAEVDLVGTDYRDTIGASTLRNQIQGSARGRVGIAVDRALFFATGGAAFAQFQTTYALPAAVGGFQNPSNTRVGYTVGGGVEYAITTQWSLRGEYRYSDFGTYRQFVGTIPLQVTRRETMQRATVGFSYKFDTIAAAPVVARY